MPTRKTHRLPRVTSVFEHPTVSGGERSMLDAMGRLRERFEWHAAAPPDSPLWSALNDMGIPCHAFERTRQPARGLAPAELTAERLADVVHCDLLHGNSLSTALFTGLAAQRLGIPAVAHVREIERLNPTRVRRVAANDCIVAVSAAVRDHLVGAGLDPARVEVVHNGVDLDLFHPDTHKGLFRHELDIPAECPVVATIGQIGLRKGTEIYLDAVARAGAELGNLHAVIVGARFSAKAENVAFEELVAERCAADHPGLTLHRLDWREDIPTVLADVDVYVHAARQEPLGRVLLEASAAGVPIVATNVGGTPEIVADGITGWLVEKDNSVALAERLVTLLRNPQDRADCGARARRRAEKMFSGDRAASTLGALFERIVGPG